MIKVGVDEVGRGALAGDLFVVAYAFDPLCKNIDNVFKFCKDSKTFSSRKKREEAFRVVSSVGFFSCVRRTPLQIESMNIRLATLDAMRVSVIALSEVMGMDLYCCFDGRDMPDDFPFLGEAVVDGDARIAEIGAASVIAKVLRDREMVNLSLVYPGYGFERNMGYGTKEHREAIGRMGLSFVHRHWAQKFVLDSIVE